jgi:hypothetical protein
MGALREGPQGEGRQGRTGSHPTTNTIVTTHVNGMADIPGTWFWMVFVMYTYSSDWKHAMTDPLLSSPFLVHHHHHHHHQHHDEYHPHQYHHCYHHHQNLTIALICIKIITMTINAIVMILRLMSRCQKPGFTQSCCQKPRLGRRLWQKAPPV